jgi:hypothetical protein
MSDILQAAVTIFLFALILGSLVLVHELGHFVTARLAGVRVLEFGIGFPPRAKILRAGGETLYTLNWLPIGGFVKLEGEDGDDGDDPRSFVRARLPTKLIILVAGVAMNLFIAFLIFTMIAWLATPLVGLKFQEVQPDSPAAAAGLTPGDTILALDHERFEFFGEKQILTELRSRAGETVVLTLEHPDGSTVDKTVTLRSNQQIDKDHGALGISSPEGKPFDFPISYESHDPATAVGLGISQTGHWFGVILAGLGDLASSFASDPTAPPPAAGPGGDRSADRRRLLRLRADRDPLRGRHPVGQPRPRQCPAVPAARRRADADDRPEVDLRTPAQPARRAVDLCRGLRRPVRVPDLGQRVRRPEDPARRVMTSSSGRCAPPSALGRRRAHAR